MRAEKFLTWTGNITVMHSEFRKRPNEPDASIPFFWKKSIRHIKLLSQIN